MSEFNNIANRIGLNDEQRDAILADATHILTEQLVRFGGIVKGAWEKSMWVAVQNAGNYRTLDVSELRDDIHILLYASGDENVVREMAAALAKELMERPEVRVIDNPFFVPLVRV